MRWMVNCEPENKVPWEISVLIFITKRFLKCMYIQQFVYFKLIVVRVNDIHIMYIQDCMGEQMCHPTIFHVQAVVIWCCPELWDVSKILLIPIEHPIGHSVPSPRSLWVPGSSLLMALLIHNACLPGSSLSFSLISHDCSALSPLCLLSSRIQYAPQFLPKPPTQSI